MRCEMWVREVRLATELCIPVGMRNEASVERQFVIPLYISNITRYISIGK